ncbi:MAG: hypothetical protein L6R19_07350 [Alphaproteobacteria bacterium]|nr:hypothetical protein [Alphaproteobacteria bacterium]
MIDRRRFLGLGMAAGAGLAAGAARAFQIQEMPPATARAYLAACEAPALHAQLLAEIDAQLAGRTLSADEIARIKSDARCPLCGCALATPAPATGDTPF